MLRTQAWRNDPTDSTSRPRRYFICDSLADRPSTGLLAGDLAFTIDTAKVYRATNATTWTEVGGGSGSGATALGELSDVDDTVAATNGHFLVADGTDYSNRALLESDIPAAIARDSEVTTAISTHEAAADPHPTYQRESEKGAASGYASLNGSTKVVEDPANATATATASKIPIADGSGKLDTWVSDASTTVKGKVELATDGESAANLAVQANDARLSNSRAPNGSASGDLTGSYPGPTIANDAVTFAKMQNSSAASKLLGRGASGAGDFEEITLGTNLSMSGTTLNASGGGGPDPFTAKLRQTADATNATTTLSNLTGLSFSFDANSFYCIEFYLLCTSAAATTGYSFALDVSVAVTNVALTFNHQLANTGTLTGGQSIADATRTGLSSGVPTAGANTPIFGGGLLMSGANAGTAQLQFAPEVAASATCKLGSVMRVMKIT